MKKKPPLRGLTYGWVSQWDDYQAQGEERILVDNINEANVINSLCVGSKPGQIRGIHKPLLDLDIPVVLVPSTTPGHSHLYIDQPVYWYKYQHLLTVLKDLGILQEGYVNGAFNRGYSSLRLPWIKKEADQPSSEWWK